ncbi:GmrSD restriction endonuclease domain-containing protein [Candidatus Methanodesulfokora washburnensis]|jgi:hypothetical protein|nr:DUF262 domain-containing protein [Candidatus Methanodesulfokores washburnensis]
MEDVGYSSLDMSGVLEDIENGKIRLPNFQRDFRWERSNITELIISLLNGYPIGVLLFWDVRGVGKENRLASRLFEGVDKDKEELSSEEYLVLDGQQRLTSLYQLFYKEFVKTKGNREIKFFLDLNEIQNKKIDDCVKSYSKKDIQRKRLDQPEEQMKNHLLPLNIILSDKLHDWIRGYMKYWPSKEGSGNADEATKMASFNKEFLSKGKPIHNLKNYKLHVIKLEYRDLDAVATIFEKLNTTGLPLNIFEILTAKFYGTMNLRNKWEKTKKDYDSIKSFTKDEKDNSLAILILKAILLKKSIEENDKSLECKRKNLLNNLTSEDIEKYWDKCAEFLHRSLNMLKGNYGCPSLRYLPYSTILVPFSLAMDFIENKLPPERRKAAYRKLERWYWASVFSERYDSGTDTKSKTDINEIIEWINDDRKIPEAIREFDIRFIDLEEVTRGARFTGILNIIIKRGAKDFLTGKSIGVLISDKPREVNVHHLFPKKWVKEENKKLRDSILNKTLLGSETNRKIGDGMPSTYIRDIMEYNREIIEDLKGHLIPPDEFMRDDFDGFIKKRKELIIREIERLVEPVKGFT